MFNNILSKLNNKYLFILCFIISISFYLLIPQSYKINESSDYIGYYKPVAENIVNGIIPEGINHELGYGYPIGFPIILSFLIQISRLISIDINTIIFIFSILCIYISAVILKEISNEFFEKNISIISSLTVVSYPLILWTIKQPNSESAFLPFLFLSTLIYIKGFKNNKNTYLFSSGILLGISMMIRPIAIGLPFVFVLFTVFYKLKTKEKIFKVLVSSLIILSGVLVTVSPWEYYVYHRINKVVPLGTVGGGGIYDGLTFNVNLKNYRIKKELPANIENLMTEFKNDLVMPPTFKEISHTLNKQLINQPSTLIEFYTYKFFRTFYATDSHRNETPIFFLQLIYLSLVAFAVIKSIKKRIMNNFEFLFLGIIFYFAFMATIALSIVRYTVPAICLMFVFLPIYFYKEVKYE